MTAPSAPTATALARGLHVDDVEVRVSAHGKARARTASGSSRDSDIMSLARILRRTQRYRCVDCGFASASHFWQCPGCRAWDAFAPVALLDVTPGMQRR